ncbi:hypothetical protein Ancab_000668 [Ancistrocladus abbreviatus]
MAIYLRSATTRYANLFAAIDMGTNSFKLTIVQFNPSTGFLIIDRQKHPVVLGRDTSSSPSTPSSISSASQSLAIETLAKFQIAILSHKITQTSVVATSAVREASNRDAFVQEIGRKLSFQVNVLSGVEEARLIYLGVLQFLPVYDRRVLTVDIGGGSTEFVIGERGAVRYAVSLNLGHVTLTQRFGYGDLMAMRQCIRRHIEESGLVEVVRNLGYEVVIGSSGTIRAVEKAICLNYGGEETGSVMVGEMRRDWGFSREELKGFVERLCRGGEGERVRRDEFFGSRSEFIVAGVVLLDEIFELLGISEMQVSGYALGEGVVADMISEGCCGYHLNANVRWRSVVRLATRCNGDSRMKCATQCAAISKEIFDGLRKAVEAADDAITIGTCLDQKDLEYLKAACLLHNIGLFLGKKGYHKQSYNILMNADHLDGYTVEETKLIALLTRHHRKKFPRLDHDSLHGVSEEVKQKFRILCSILRMSVIIQQNWPLNTREIEISCTSDGLKLVLKEIKDQPALSSSDKHIAVDSWKGLSKELEHFEAVFHQKLSVAVCKSSSE